MTGANGDNSPSVHPTAKASTIEIVDRGRGLQLSTSRITIQDVVPYLQQNCTNEEIHEIMPLLSDEEINVIRQYVLDNYSAVMEQDRLIRERNATRAVPPQIQAIRARGHAKVLQLMEQFAKNTAREKNGDHSSR